ncbi:SIR2 family protein [Agrobacterium tumefaciens]|uniref:SIR2 family protein n=1 Tax=Agrobacterium tumefaciens TaxID=358 RepID=UPI0012B6F8D2|nr:SIR2 family protein [Agrobacterium tumefaciens]MQB05733.1 SIR2 family protein [Agrobacterium tumefaciens]
MIYEEERELLEQIDNHLSMPHQAWLFGAGISFNAGIPLMDPLTSRVIELLGDSAEGQILSAIKADLPENAHIEHLLSHLGDYCALAERSKDNTASIAGTAHTLDVLEALHSVVARHISNTIRWGYRKDGDAYVAGNHETPIVKIDEHLAFAHALFRRNHAGLQQRRGPVRIFTTNYDTLLEDALALSGVTYWDGFSGGALAFRAHRFGDAEPTSGHRCHLVKLHGSIDWHLSTSGQVWRIRDGDLYPDKTGRVLIYPQSTKYVATQKDPFASQFELLRRTLSSSADNVLCICGYSFGDDHINQEMELGLARFDSKTTVVAFLKEEDALPECLDRWRKSPWGERIYIITEKGIYSGSADVACPPSTDLHSWWTFSGATQALKHGLGSFVK